MAKPEPPVAFVIADLDCGGTQRVVATMANAWAAQGRAVTVVTLAGADRDFFTLDHRVRRIVLGGLGISRSLRAGLLANLRRLASLRRVIKGLDAPVLSGFIAQTNVTLILATVGLGRRIVISERNDPRRQSLGPIWDRLRQWCYPLADVVTANSREVVEAMRAFVPARKLAYLPNPLALPGRKLQGGDGSGPTILCVARLDAHKGVDVLIDAFAALSAQHPAWRLCIVGEGPLHDDLAVRAGSHGIENKVIFCGRVVDPYSLYCGADIFVLASRYEGMPNTVLEAMSCGLPPVVSDRTVGALEYVEDGVSGLVVPAGDTGALAQALERLIIDESLRRVLGRAARERVRELSLDNVSAVWEDVLFAGIPASPGCKATSKMTAVYEP